MSADLASTSDKKFTWGFQLMSQSCEFDFRLEEIGGLGSTLGYDTDGEPDHYFSNCLVPFGAVQTGTEVMVKSWGMSSLQQPAEQLQSGISGAYMAVSETGSFVVHPHVFDSEAAVINPFAPKVEPVYAKWLSKKTVSQNSVNYLRGERKNDEDQIVKDLSLLEKVYSFIRPREVRVFLRENPEYCDVLFEALGKIRSTFKENAKKTELSRFVDPDSGSTSLLIQVQTNLDSNGSLDILDQLDDMWIIPSESSLLDKIIITVRSNEF